MIWEPRSACKRLGRQKTDSVEFASDGARAQPRCLLVLTVNNDGIVICSIHLRERFSWERQCLSANDSLMRSIHNRHKNNSRFDNLADFSHATRNCKNLRKVLYISSRLENYAMLCPKNFKPAHTLFRHKVY